MASIFFSKNVFFQLFVSLLILETHHYVTSSRITRAVMMSVAPNVNYNCSDLTITGKNMTSHIIVTGTVSTCSVPQAGSYRCTLQIWRVMKGKKLISNRSIESQQGPYNQKLYVNVYGLGNNIYCESNVKDHDTRIFFLNRSNNRLVLSASLLRITLSNLQNTQAVIEGQKIVEIPKKPYDPCLSILCGYGAHCEVSGGLAYCVCPDFLCDSSEERLELNAPFCGSDGVTYPNECKLQDVQCMTQKRIKAVSSSPCEPDCDGEDRGSEICKVSSTTTAPVPSVNLCNSTYCGFSADCVVKAGPNGRMAPSCECPTCEGAGVKPVCASDQKSYTSVCELRRKACNEASNISIVRHSACSPCQVYDDTMKDFVLACSDGCLLTQSGEMLCCSDVKCQSSRPGSVCGSDGNNYESECALKRYACSTARNISVIRYDLCPNKRSTTIARGTITLENDLNCPGECDPGNNRFQKFIRKLESSVNKLISVLSADDIDGRKMEEFSVVGTRNDGTILFKAGVSTSMNPIGLEQHPGDGYEWVAGWLLDQAIVVVLRNEEVTFKLPSAPHDKLFIEDVCLDVQCEHGAVCALRREEEVLLPSCSCQDIGDADRGPVTMACMLASDGISHDLRFMNENDMRKNMCSSRSFYTFRDGCIDSPMNSCADIGGCTAPGQVCMQVDGRSVCGCITCNDEDEPVCGSDGQTYRSECELVRENCTSGGGLSLRRSGHCESQCDDVKCWYGAQCEVEAEGTICVCPTNCLASISPVCGSDCVSYSNECEMVVEMCEKKLNLHVIHRGTCDDSAECAEVGSGLSDTGSGEDDDCQCRFGATCDGTRDDEDSECVCSFTCPQSPVDEMCAADDVTYINACEHKRAECEKQTSIPIIGIGSCADVCRTSRYGCCQDGETSAKGPAKAGCPEMCKCNVHGSYGSSCELSGQCVCKPGVGGLKCDRCKPGFWNFRGLAQGLGTGCMACRCHSDGSTRDDCEQMTGRCQCKEGVRGSKCSQCESDGSWVTSAVCRENTGLPSCAGQVCGTGQECINIDGSFTCQCPNFSDCDGFQGPEICGSDGLSYPDACQMRVMACKQGVEVHAVAEGLCKAYPIEETLPSGEEGYPTPSSDTPDASVGSSTTPTVPPSTTTLVTSTTTSYIDNEIEASISPDCEFDDDEDCLGSGMEHLMESSTAVQQSESSTTLSASSRLQESTTLQSTSTTFRSSAQHDQFFTATGIFKEVDGQTLNYDADLSDPTSSPFEEYNNLITSKVTEYLGNPLLNGQITSVRIASFADNQHWFWGSNGVKVDMVIHHDSAASPEQLLELLNKVSDIPHEFSVSEQAGSA